jgi:hypothetical protein
VKGAIGIRNLVLVPKVDRGKQAPISGSSRGSSKKVADLSHPVIGAKTAAAKCVEGDERPNLKEE